MKYPRAGELVEVAFLDHVEDGDDAIEFLVWGRVANVTRTSLVIHSWAYADPPQPVHNPFNVKTFCIVKKAILRWHALAPK